MKHTRIYFLLAALLLLAGCGRGSSFVVKSTLEDARFSDRVDSVMVLNDQMQVALKAPVVNGEFTVHGKVDGAVYTWLSALGDTRRANRPFIAEKGTVTFQDGLACGTPLNDEDFAFTKRLQGLRDQFSGDALKDATLKEFIDFITRHPSDPCALYAIHLGESSRLPRAWMKQIIEAASPAIQNDTDVKAIYSLSLSE